MLDNCLPAGDETLFEFKPGRHGLSSSNEYLIAETDGWSVSHRKDSALPGYLMVGCKTDTTKLSELPEPHLSEIGPLLARA